MSPVWNIKKIWIAFYVFYVFISSNVNSSGATEKKISAVLELIFKVSYHLHLLPPDVWPQQLNQIKTLKGIWVTEMVISVKVFSI